MSFETLAIVVSGLAAVAAIGAAIGKSFVAENKDAAPEVRQDRSRRLV